MTPSSSRTLSSWKEIAAYLGRDERTVRRWEQERGLPVHRGPKGKGHSVYATTADLDRWLLSDGQQDTGQTSEAPLPKPTADRRLVSRSLAVTSFLVVVAFSLSFALAWRRPSAAAPTARTMLVVLPFQNFSGEPKNEYLSNGLTEELISQLGGLSPGKLGIIARTSAMTYKNSRKSVADIGRELNVNYLVEGSIRQSEHGARITVQLIRVGDQTHIWAESYDRAPGEILAMERDLAETITFQVRQQVGVEVRQRVEKKWTPSAAALEAYLKGRYYWNKRTAEDLKKSVDFFQQAIAQQPDYASAHAGLADAYLVMGDYAAMSPDESYPLAEREAERALQLDDSLAEPHATIASVKADHERDWKGAEREFRRAMALNPDYATAHQWLSGNLTALGRHDEAIAEMRRALELDPLSRIINANLGTAYYAARRYDEAILQLKKTLEIEPGFAYAHSRLGFAYQAKGMLRDAEAEFQKALELSDGQPTFLAGLGTTYALEGRKREAEAVASKMCDLNGKRYVSPFAIALVYMRLEKTDEAFRWLQRARESRDDNLIFLNVEPTFDPLHLHAQFHQLLQSLNLDARSAA